MKEYFPKEGFVKRLASKKVAQDTDFMDPEGLRSDPDTPENLGKNYVPEDPEEILYLALRAISSGASDAVSIASKALSDFETAKPKDSDPDEYRYDSIHGEDVNK